MIAKMMMWDYHRWSHLTLLCFQRSNSTTSRLLGSFLPVQGRIFDLLLSAEVGGSSSDPQRAGNGCNGFRDCQVEMQEDFVSQQEALFNKPSTDAWSKWKVTKKGMSQGMLGEFPHGILQAEFMWSASRN